MKKIELLLMVVLLIIFNSFVFAQAVNVNTATEKEIMTIKGIGAVKAVSIVAHCQIKTPCRKLDDLLLVKGIGNKILKKIEPFIIFEDNLND